MIALCLRKTPSVSGSRLEKIRRSGKMADFRRFSSKISGGCGAALPFIEHVIQMARTFFGLRVHPWSEWGYEGEPDPVYSWNEVNEADALARLKDAENC